MPRLLAEIVEFGLLGWLGLLALIVAVQVLRGDISLQGLLSTHGAGIDPERVQSLLVVGFVFLAYVVEFAEQRSGAKTLPDLPSSLLAVLAGSNGVYLAGKVARTGAFSQSPN